VVEIRGGNITMVKCMRDWEGKQTKIQKLINHNWGFFPNVGLHPDAI
jgi:hypothetical protein